MSRRSWWTALIGTGLALVGVWGPWIPHRAAALVLSDWDLAEFVKFLPATPAIRELFYLPVWCAGIVLGVLASQQTNKHNTHLGKQIVLMLIALGLMVAILPPYPSLLNGYGSPEFRWQFILGVSGALIVLLCWLMTSPLAPALNLPSLPGFGTRWPARAVGGLIMALALVGLVTPLWQFLRVQNAIEAVYGSDLGRGWGLAVFLAGWVLIGATGGRLLLTGPPSRS